MRPIHNTQFRCVLADSALTIMRGGYNTSFELASAGKPYVMIPRIEKALEEQTMRARTMAKHGFCSLIPQQELTPEHLAETIDEEYSRDRTNVVPLDTNGVKHGSKALIEIAARYKTATPDTEVSLDTLRRMESGTVRDDLLPPR